MPTVTTDNSYVTLEEAAALLDEYPGTEAWGTLLEATQAQHVIWATKLLKRLLGDYAAEVPEATLKEATARQAFFLSENQAAIENATALGVGSTTQHTVGRLSEATPATGFDWRKGIHPEVLADLQGYRPGINTINIVRA